MEEHAGRGPYSELSTIRRGRATMDNSRNSTGTPDALDTRATSKELNIGRDCESSVVGPDLL
jgi:hypothetical protein